MGVVGKTFLGLFLGKLDLYTQVRYQVEAPGQVMSVKCVKCVKFIN